MRRFLKQRVFLISFLISPFAFMGTLLTHDMDSLTGRAIVNIPLGEISAYDLSVGVSLF
jgi:hypothetical protein